MTFTIRPFADDFAEVASLLNAVNPDPITPDALRASHARFPADGVRYRAVAVTPTGDVIGYANTFHMPHMKDGYFWLTLITRPDARLQGVATALLAHAEPWVGAHGGTCIGTGVPDDDRIALTFGTGRGFHIQSIQLESRLTVPTFDETPWAPAIDNVAQSGIRFFTLADRPGDETIRNLYELYKTTDLDSPGYIGLPADQYPKFDQWYDDIFGDDRIIPEGVIIAADGDRFIGCTILQKTGDEGGLYTEYTGVLREYRGHQIALALKLLSVRFAKQYGAPYMTTKNDSTNAPMLAINEKMGYVKTSGRAWLRKEL
ncbi:MAG: family N-acetyltransferase [Symbiobacteriaceae bacterium]|jgi:GNAT superfamily N-acetyltransferase|nr:family N-acetyltransferase [Symbiobacteriaceae bacterium]